jgi:hypothetical protein
VDQPRDGSSNDRTDLTVVAAVVEHLRDARAAGRELAAAVAEVDRLATRNSVRYGAIHRLAGEMRTAEDPSGPAIDVTAQAATLADDLTTADNLLEKAKTQVERGIQGAMSGRRTLVLGGASGDGGRMLLQQLDQLKTAFESAERVLGEVQDEHIPALQTRLSDLRDWTADGLAERAARLEADAAQELDPMRDVLWKLRTDLKEVLPAADNGSASADSRRRSDVERAGRVGLNPQTSAGTPSTRSTDPLQSDGAVQNPHRRAARETPAKRFDL